MLVILKLFFVQWNGLGKPRRAGINTFVLARNVPAQFGEARRSIG